MKEDMGLRKIVEQEKPAVGRGHQSRQIFIKLL